MRAAFLLGALLLFSAGCGAPPPSEATGERTENGVRVAVTVTAEELRVLFQPERQGFHIYSVDLPDEGVDGLGIPTRVSVRGGLEAAGALTADRPVRTLDLPELGVSLPVYPDGPVEFRLPVERRGSEAEVVVSYGACSEGLCLPPVRDLAIPIDLP